MAEVADDDLVEQILVRLAVKYLIRCKRVCKSWHSLISTPRFIKRHLNHSNNKERNNNEIGHRRISSSNDHLVGSSNGLVVVCISNYISSELIVGNPLTREVTQLRPPSLYNSPLLCWGFGYDSSNDDYKVLVGAFNGLNQICVQLQVLCLKSNVWKDVGDLKYTFVTKAGVLCNGSLHWLVADNENWNLLIVSFDLSKEEFNEIPQPDDARYVCNNSSRLGIVNESLCIYEAVGNAYNLGIWMMKEYDVRKSWQLLPHGFEMKYDIVHYLKSPKLNNLFRIDESCFYGTLEYICAPTRHISDPIFVQSLVAPHVNRNPEEEIQVSNSNRLRFYLPLVYHHALEFI